MPGGGPARSAAGEKCRALLPAVGTVLRRRRAARSARHFFPALLPGTSSPARSARHFFRRHFFPGEKCQALLPAVGTVLRLPGGGGCESCSSVLPGGAAAARPAGSEKCPALLPGTSSPARSARHFFRRHFFPGEKCQALLPAVGTVLRLPGGGGCESCSSVLPGGAAAARPAGGVKARHLTLGVSAAVRCASVASQVSSDESRPPTERVGAAPSPRAPREVQRREKCSAARSAAPREVPREVPGTSSRALLPGGEKCSAARSAVSAARSARHFFPAGASPRRRPWRWGPLATPMAVGAGMSRGSVDSWTAIFATASS